MSDEKTEPKITVEDLPITFQVKYLGEKFLRLVLSGFIATKNTRPFIMLNVYYLK